MADYVTATAFLARYDYRDVADLVSDDNTTVTATSLLTDANLLVAIGDASGDIDAALLVGNKYETSDLEGLSGNAQSHLYRMCSDLTMYYLMSRRPDFSPDRLEAYEKIRLRHLGRLQAGEDVFNLDGHLSAGVVTVDGPTMQNYQDLNLVRDRVQNYYPRRHLPDNR